MIDSSPYYNKESKVYSKNRYEGPLRTYTQFLFRRRLRIFISMLQTVLVGKENKKISLFEIGSADGVIVRTIMKRFPKVFEVVGVDTAEEMVHEAGRMFATSDDVATFFKRGEEPLGKFDIVVRLGVHTENLKDELAYCKSKLKEKGYLFYSFAGRKSLHARIKLKDKSYLSDYKTYAEYGKIFSEGFEILDSKVYGFFIPKLWVIPFVGKTVQPFEIIFSALFPEFFHEKIYFLRLK